MDCVTQILEYYNKRSMGEIIDITLTNKVQLSNLLIKLMNRFNQAPIDKFDLRNCLILLVNLFSDDDCPDHYNKKGKSAKELSDEEKQIYREMLLTEFN